MSDQAIKSLHTVNPDDWRADIELQKDFLDSIGDRLPSALRKEFENFKLKFNS